MCKYHMNSSTLSRKEWRLELTAGGISLVETKIQRGIFQGDGQSLLLFIIAMMTLNPILRKYTAGCHLRKKGSII